MKTSITFCLLLLVFASCSKHNENAYSHWHIGKDTFYTNNTVVDVYEHGMSMNVGFFGAAWQIGFLFPFGSFAGEEGRPLTVVDFLRSYYSCRVGFSNDTAGYGPSNYSNANIVVMLVNGKETWDMPDTWFVNSKNPDDSLLFGGHFSEP